MLEVYTAVAELLRASNMRSDQMAAGCAKCGACSALSLFEQSAFEQSAPEQHSVSKSEDKNSSPD
jgi:hypothetical protein